MIASVFIIYYQWPNTSGNHAGMAYFSHQLKQSLKKQVHLLKVPDVIGGWNHHLQRFWQLAATAWLRLSMQPQDTLFFNEYLGGRQCGDHRAIAFALRRQGIRNRMVGLVHLPPQSLEKLYNRDYIISGLSALDDILVFGSSLEKYFTDLGFEGKIQRAFHYVDTDFYRPLSRPRNERFTVIASGSLLRNHDVLAEIIAACPLLHFQVCMGKADLRSHFVGLPNVILHPFLMEIDLLSLMQNADVSLSVFDDTIGSNVIVTSMACGLPQVVSDVGSVRDYCSTENAIFCNSTDDFVMALNHLAENSALRVQMGQTARRRSEDFSLDRSIAWFRDFFSLHNLIAF